MGLVYIYQEAASIQRDHGDWYVKGRVFRCFSTTLCRGDREKWRERVRGRWRRLTESSFGFKKLPLFFSSQSLSLYLKAVKPQREIRNENEGNSKRLSLSFSLRKFNCMQLNLSQMTYIPFLYLFYLFIYLGMLTERGSHVTRDHDMVGPSLEFGCDPYHEIVNLT